MVCGKLKRGNCSLTKKKCNKKYIVKMQKFKTSCSVFKRGKPVRAKKRVVKKKATKRKTVKRKAVKKKPTKRKAVKKKTRKKATKKKKNFFLELFGQ